MAFSAQTSLVRLLLEDHGVVTECELATNDAVDELDFPAIFREHEVLWSVRHCLVDFGLT